MLDSAFRPIGRGEWRWASVVAALLALAVAAPYGLALVRPPEGYVLARTLYYGNDLSQYAAAMGDGAASASWLIQDHLTAEPHSPALMYPFYVLLGKVAQALAVPHMAVFALTCALAIPALVFSAYYFAAAFAAAQGQRRAALVFILLASGLGIWAAALASGGTGAAGRAGFSYDRAEVSTYLLPFGPPHLTLALAALLAWGGSLARWAWRGDRSSLAALAASVVAVGLLNPFTLATMAALSGGYALFRWVSGRAFPARETVAAALVGAVGAPLFLANVMTFALDPFWSVTYGQQNTTGSPPLWTLAVDFGLLVPLAVAGCLDRKTPPERRTLIVFWVLALLALMYLPVPFQRRFGFGLQPALALLAALGLGYVGEYLRKRRLFLLNAVLRVLVGVGLFAGTFMGYVLLIMAAGGIGPLGETIYEPRGNAAAADWLASRSGPADVVLASVETSNYLAGRIRGRVMVAHGAGTLDFDAKRVRMRRFFDPATSSVERREIARAERVTLVVLGEREQSLGLTALGSEDGFTAIYDAGGVRVYRVE